MLTELTVLDGEKLLDDDNTDDASS